MTAQIPMAPGQFYAKRFALYSALGVPKITLEDWRLSITGLVEKELTISFEQLRSLPRVELTRDFHCLAPGSMVFTDSAPKPIEEVRVGDHIIGLDGRRHLVRRILRKTHDGQLARIKAGYLPAVSLTPDHMVWAIRGHPGVGRSRSKRRKRTFEIDPSPEWIPTDKLKVGDYLFFPAYREVQNRTTIAAMGQRLAVDDLLAFVLGWYVAEGSGADSKGRTVRFALNTSEKSHARILSSALRQLFGARVSVYRRQNMNLVTVTSSNTKNLPSLLKSWCGNDAFSKRIPEFILNGKHSILRVFISALIDGDGYCAWRSHSKRSKYSHEDLLDITTSSTKLAYQLILALSKLGVPAGIVDHPGSVRNSYSVRVHGFDQIKKILPYERLRFARGVDRRHYWQTPDGVYYPVVKIERSRYKGPVYDFTADGFTMLSPFAMLDCVTQWSIKDVVWEGVRFRELAKLTHVRPEARWVLFHCADGYTTPAPIEDAMAEDSLIALKMNNAPIPPEQGFPVRPFIPHLYAWKSAKWLTKIEFRRDYEDGYWEARGYHERGKVADEERFKNRKRE